MLKGGTRHYIVIIKQSYASWSSKNREHHFVFTKSLLKKAIKFPLHNYCFSIGNIIIIQVIGIPLGSDPAPYFANLFLAHKEAEIPFGFRNTIYPTELELKKENNSNYCASFLDIYIYIENGEFHTRLYDKQDNFGFDNVRMPFYCS